MGLDFVCSFEYRRVDVFGAGFGVAVSLLKDSTG